LFINRNYQNIPGTNISGISGIQEFRNYQNISGNFREFRMDSGWIQEI